MKKTHKTERRSGSTSGKSLTAAERQERGQVRIDVWLPPEVASVLDKLAAKHGSKTAAIIAAIVSTKRGRNANT